MQPQLATQSRATKSARHRRGITAAVASFTYRILPVWLGVLAVLVALGALAPWIGIAIFGVWVLAASIVELISASRPEITADVS